MFTRCSRTFVILRYTAAICASVHVRVGHHVEVQLPLPGSDVGDVHANREANDIARLERVAHLATVHRRVVVKLVLDCHTQWSLEKIYNNIKLNDIKCARYNSLLTGLEPIFVLL